MAFPELEAELAAMAASTVKNWALLSSTFDLLMGHLLFPSKPTAFTPMKYLTPGHEIGPLMGFAPGTTLWTTGVKVIRMTGAKPLTEPQAVALRDMLAEMDARIPDHLVWTDDETTADTIALRGATAGGLRHVMRVLTGRLCVEWVPYLEIATLLPRSEHISLPDFDPSAFGAGALIRDVLSWRIAGPATIALRAQRRGWRPSIRPLFLVLVALYPEVIFTSSTSDELRLYATLHDHPVTVRVYTPTKEYHRNFTLAITTSTTGPNALASATSRPHAVQALNAFGGQELKVKDAHPHPLINRLVCLWVGKRRWRTSQQRYKKAALTTTPRHGTQDVKDRQHAWRKDQPGIAEALAQID